MKRARPLLAGFVGAAVLTASSALAADALEARLIRAMSYSKAKMERLDDPGSAIRAYIAAGLVDRKPTRRMDYTDYRVLKAPATLLGQKLLVIEEEYLTQYIGCCVNEGVGAIVELSGDEAPLRDFAKRNGCAIDEQYVRERLGDLKLSVGGKVAAISCRQRDAL